MSVPMSMEEWQNRLRAQKEQDRQNKNKSAEILHGYQAKEEEETQRKIRESRRQSQMKKNEAKEFLANYRPDAANIEALTPTKANNSSSNFKFDGPLPPVVSAPTKDNPRDAIAAGAVSSIAANFTGNSTLSKAFYDSACDKNNFSFTEIRSSEAEPCGSSDMNQDWVQVTSDEIAIPGSGNTGGADADQIDTEMTQTSYDQQPTSSTDDAMTSVVQDQTTSEESKSPQYNRLDIDFSFGLISTRAQPSLDAYMQGVQEVLWSALEDNLEMQKQLSYNFTCPPYVKGIQKDESYDDPDGRSTVQRLLVKAAVPVFITNNIAPKKIRSFVIKTLAAALKQGYFLKIAEDA